MSQYIETVVMIAVVLVLLYYMYKKRESWKEESILSDRFRLPPPNYDSVKMTHQMMQRNEVLEGMHGHKKLTEMSTPRMLHLNWKDGNENPSTTSLMQSNTVMSH